MPLLSLALVVAPWTNAIQGRVAIPPEHDMAGKHAAGTSQEMRQSAVTGRLGDAPLPRGQRLVGTKSYDGATSITLKSRSPEVDGAASVIVLVVTW